MGAPNLGHDLEALAVKGRIVIVGTGAGTEAQLDLRELMGRRATPDGHRAARPAARGESVRGRRVRPGGSAAPRDGRIVPLVDRVFPAADAADAFDRLEAPGKLGKVLLDFAG